MDATDQEEIHFNESNDFTAFAVYQDLLLWEATLAMMEMQSSIAQSIKTKPDKNNNKSSKK